MRTKSNPVDGNWDHQIERAVGQWMSAHNGLYPDLCLVEPWVQKQLFRDPRAIRHMRVDPGNKERLYYRGMELRVGCALTYMLLSMPRVTSSRGERVAS
jgi:hypothetical protein